MAIKSSASVLLVDDDPLILVLGRELLTHLDYRVEVASNAAMAMQVFESQRPDLVLLDYQLPDMDGHELFQELRKVNAGVRVVVASGFLSKQEADCLKQGGVRGIIYKPFRLAELQRQIQAALAV